MTPAIEEETINTSCLSVDVHLSLRAIGASSQMRGVYADGCGSNTPPILPYRAVT